MQSYVEKKYRDIPYNILWRCMGIWTPSSPSLDRDRDGVPVCDLDRPDLGTIKDFLCNPTAWIYSYLDNRQSGNNIEEKIINGLRVAHQCPADFMVIHLTMLEKLAGSNKSTQDILLEFRGCCGVGEECEIIVVSGRGVPVESLSKKGEELKARFLPVSAILEHLVSRPSKLALTQALWSAIKPRSQAS